MSAYLSSEDVLRALATYWEESLLRNRYETTGGALERAIGCSALAAGKRWPEDCAVRARDLVRLARGSAAGVVFELLLAENVASLEARYPESPEMWSAAAGYRFKPSPQVRRWLNGYQHGSVVGLVRGYSYQACEHPGWETSIGWQLVQQIKDQLLKHLESRDCGEAQLWASWEEPEQTEPVPVRLSALLGA